MVGLVLSGYGLVRQLTQAGQAAYEPGLALAMSNLAAELSVLGRFDEALAAVEESAQIRQRLAAVDPAHEPGLAQAVTNLGVILGLSGRWEQELDAAGRAARIWERLAVGNHAAYGPACGGRCWSIRNSAGQWKPTTRQRSPRG